MFILYGGKQSPPPGTKSHRNLSQVMIRSRVSQECEHQVQGADFYFPLWFPTSIPLAVSLQQSSAFLSDTLLGDNLRYPLQCCVIYPPLFPFRDPILKLEASCTRKQSKHR